MAQTTVRQGATVPLQEPAETAETQDPEAQEVQEVQLTRRAQPELMVVVVVLVAAYRWLELRVRLAVTAPNGMALTDVVVAVAVEQRVGGMEAHTAAAAVARGLLAQAAQVVSAVKA